MTVLAANELIAIMPHVPDQHTWAAALATAMGRYAITRPDRAPVFLAHVAVESGECRRLVENMNYTAARISQVWPSRFPTVQTAFPYARNPERLANRVYANRMGNGNEASGDGWRYRGRGLLQVTGRGNYREVGAAIGLDLETQPDLLLEAGAAALSAAQFFASRGCNVLADDTSDDNDDEDFVRTTLIINGGRNGLAERRRYWERAKRVLGGGTT